MKQIYLDIITFATPAATFFIGYLIGKIHRRWRARNG